MPEHDLLMQLNNDVKNLCAAVGRLEQKVDSAILTNQKQCDEYFALEERVTALEHKDLYRTGVAAGIALIISWLMGWLK